MALHSLAFIVGAISRFLSWPTQKKKMPSFVGFIGFDWFEILKRVGFCVILYVWILVVGVSRRVDVREDGGGGISGIFSLVKLMGEGLTV